MPISPIDTIPMTGLMGTEEDAMVDYSFEFDARVREYSNCFIHVPQCQI